MLKAMLVDDEPNILRNLQTVLPWAELGFEVTATARNGEEALRLAEAKQPDLVLSDIRMPSMDGIAFVRALRERSGECDILMITGYQQFDYVKELLKYGVSDYILKPIDYDGLAETIRQTGERLRERRLRRLEQERQWSHMRRAAKEKLLHDVIAGLITDANPWWLEDDGDSGSGSQAAGDEPSAGEERYRMWLVDVDEPAPGNSAWGDRRLRGFAVGNVLRDVLQHEGTAHAVLQLREGEWCLLVESPSATTSAGASPHEALLRAGMLAERLQSAVSAGVGLDVSVAVEPEPVPAAELAGTYKQLQRAMQLRTQERRAVLTCGDAGGAAEPSHAAMWELVEAMAGGLRALDRAKTEDAFRRLREELRGVPAASFARAERLLHFLALHLMRELHGLHRWREDEEEAVWRELEASEGVAGLLRVLRRMLDAGLQAGDRKKPAELLMEQAEAFMRERYAADFGIEDVASKLGISPSYFSLLFKQHFGETFLERLTKLRMEKAIGLLLHTDKSVSDISRSVGFAERRYFTKVFQKFTGEIPSEYRDKRKR